MPNETATTATTPAFGSELRAADFGLEPDYIHVNNGAFGTCPNPVMDEYFRLLRSAELCPDRFLRWEVMPQVRAVLDRVGDLLDCRGEDLVFVNNATSGVATAIANLSLGPGDVVIAFEYVYGACHNILKRTCEESGASLDVIGITFPITDEEFVALLAERLEILGDAAKAVLVDHIVSTTAMVIPVKEIVELCRPAGVTVCVDAAHAPLHIDVSLATLQPDYWVGNLHKWAFAPRGLAVMYVRPELQASAKPLVTSWGYGNGYQNEFGFQGTSSDCNKVVVGAALDYIDRFGVDNIRDYMLSLQAHCVSYTEATWGTKALGMTRSAPGLRVIALPDIPWLDKTSSATARLSGLLMDKYRISIYCFNLRGENYCRFSFHIYNEADEYNRVVDLIAGFVTQTAEEAGYDTTTTKSWELSVIQTQAADEAAKAGPSV